MKEENPMSEEIRCRKCLLNQFMTVSGNCRKCKAPLDPVEEIEPEPIMSICDTFRPLGDTMQFRISERVRELRKLRNKSQREIAELMGCPRTYISKIENGFALPNIKQIARFAAVFGVTPYEFMLTAEEIRRQNFLTDPFIAELALDLPNLNPDRRKEVIRFASLLERQHARSAGSQS
jgi:transcriptional regulator with XRE-family HTH domain